MVDLRKSGDTKTSCIFLPLRESKLRYAQFHLRAFLGPIIHTPVFHHSLYVGFGGLAKGISDGMPYFLFSYLALLALELFLSTLTGVSFNFPDPECKTLITKVISQRMGLATFLRFLFQALGLF